MLKSRPSSPNTPPDCAVRAWITCDGIIQGDGPNAGQECLSVAPPAFGPTTAAAEAAAAEEALAALWTHPTGSDLWLCHQCTVEHAALPVGAWKPGTVLLCISREPGDQTDRGRLLQVVKVTQHAEGHCHWVCRWANATPGRKRANGARTGARPAGFDTSSTSPIPAICRSDYLVWPVPEGYDGRNLLDELDPEAAARLSARQDPMAPVFAALTAAPAARTADDERAERRRLMDAEWDRCLSDRPPDADPAGYQPDTLYHLPVGELAPDPDQPRVEFEPEALAALAADMAVAGQQTPVTFRVGTSPAGARQLYLVHGERRWRAAQLAALPTVAALLDRPNEQDEDPAGRLFRQATDNDLHQTLSAWDWACLCRRLSEPPHDMGPTEIAAELERRGIKGKSRPVVSTLIALHRLPEWAVDRIRAGDLTVAHGKYLLPHVGRPDVMATLKKWVDAELAPKKGPPAETPDAATEEPGRPRATVSQLRAAIYSAYFHLYPPLEGYGYYQSTMIAPEFDRASCETCPSRVLVDKYHQDKKTPFCLNPECFLEKNATAKPPERQAEEATWERTQRRIKARQQAIIEAAMRLPEWDMLALVLWRMISGDYQLRKQLADGTDGYEDVRGLLTQDHDTRKRLLPKLIRAKLTDIYNADEEHAVAALLGVDLDAAVAAAERTEK